MPWSYYKTTLRSIGGAMKKFLAILALVAIAVTATMSQTLGSSTPSPAAGSTTSTPATPGASASSTPIAPAPVAPTSATAPTPAAATTAPLASPPAAPASTTGSSVSPPPSTPAQEGPHYLVTSALGPERGAKLLAKLETLFGIYNKVFRFDESRLPGKLLVREFSSKADFDSYLLKISGETRSDFVYVHYANPQKRELLLFDKSEPDYDTSLAHQAFVQFIKAYIDEPPLWMLDGFAILFEDLHFAEGTANPIARENLAWLPTVKALLAKGALMPLDKFLVASPDDVKANLDVFYPESWAFVSFLVNDREGDYTRLLWETVATLEPQASLDDNQSAFAKRLADWYGTSQTRTAFETYIQSRLTYPELLSSGTDL